MSEENAYTKGYNQGYAKGFSAGVELQKQKDIDAFLKDLYYWLNTIEEHEGYTNKYILNDIKSKWVVKKSG